jgi:hypothetical protein
MSPKRSPRKQATPAALPVPRVRAVRSDDMPEQIETVETKMRPRRNRKPKFVF